MTGRSCEENQHACMHVGRQRDAHTYICRQVIHKKKAGNERERRGRGVPGADRVVVQVHFENVGLGELQALAVWVGELCLVRLHTANKEKERRGRQQRYM